jgi:hypothetical protein
VTIVPVLYLFQTILRLENPLWEQQSRDHGELWLVNRLEFGRPIALSNSLSSDIVPVRGSDGRIAPQILCIHGISVLFW